MYLLPKEDALGKFECLNLPVFRQAWHEIHGGREPVVKLHLRGLYPKGYRRRKPRLSGGLCVFINKTKSHMSFLTHLFAIIVVPFVVVAGLFVGHPQNNQPVAVSVTVVATTTDENAVSTTTSNKPEEVLSPNVSQTKARIIPAPTTVLKPQANGITCNGTYYAPCNENAGTPVCLEDGSNAYCRPFQQTQQLQPTIPLFVPQTQLSTPSLDTNSADIADLENTLNDAITQFWNLESDAESFAVKVSSDSITISPSIPSFASYASQTLSTNTALVNEIESYIGVLRSEISKTQTSGMDKQYWMTTGIPTVVSTQRNYTSQALALQQTYEQGLLQIKMTLQSHSAPQFVQSTTPDPAQMYKDCAMEESKADQQIRNGITAGGGSATESQVQGMIVNQMKKDGFGYCLYLQ